MIYQSKYFEYLRVERKFIEFKVFEEAATDHPPFADDRLTAGPEGQRLPNCLRRLAEPVDDVQTWVPVLLPIDGIKVLLE